MLKANSEAHSNFIGGSNARARIACPASWQMEQKLPPSAKRETSTYADEGSALHAAIAHALNHDLAAQDLLGMAFPPYEAYPITQELIDTALAPCLDFFEFMVEEDADFYVEKRVAIPFLPGVFGTCDVLAKDGISTIVGDWKFGVGEKVEVWREIQSEAEIGNKGVIQIEMGEDYGTPNAQVMFYALGALHTCPEMFEDRPDWPVELFIMQPRFRGDEEGEMRGSRIVTVTRADVEAFGELLLTAAAEAKLAMPPMAMGDHCRFMPCKTICPLHTGPLIELPDFQKQLTTMQLEAAVDGGEGVASVDWGSTYRLMLNLANQLEPLLHDWRVQAQAYAEEGGNIPDWKLVDKRATRKWVKPEKSVERRLAREGLSKDERMPRALLSPPQAEKVLKARGKKLPAGYFDAISSGTTLAPADDPRQSVEPVSDAIAALTTALSDLRSEGL